MSLDCMVDASVGIKLFVREELSERAAGARDALDRGQVQGRMAQRRDVPDQVERFLLELLDATLKVPDVDLDVIAHVLEELCVARSASSSASSTLCSSAGLHCYGPARANDGDRSTALGGFTSWSNGVTALPQWLQPSWPALITATRVEVYTSSGYPIADYDIERWTGSAWATVLTVCGNTSLHRTHTFAATSTTALRIVGRRGPSHQPPLALTHHSSIRKSEKK